MYRLPVEQKLKLVQRERQQDLESRKYQEASLRQYLATSASEVVYEKKSQIKETLTDQGIDQGKRG